MGGGSGSFFIRPEIRDINDNDLEDLIKKTIEKNGVISKSQLRNVLNRFQYFVNQKELEFNINEVEYLIHDKIERYTGVSISIIDNEVYYRRLPELKERFEEEKSYY